MEKYLPISELAKRELQDSVNNLCNTIKKIIGESELWYESNALCRKIDNLPVGKEAQE